MHICCVFCSLEILLTFSEWIYYWQFGRGDHGRLGYGRKVTTGHPSEVPINISAPTNLSGGEAEGRWCAKLVACGGRHTLAIVEWHSDESERLLYITIINCLKSQLALSLYNHTVLDKLKCYGQLYNGQSEKVL